MLAFYSFLSFLTFLNLTMLLSNVLSQVFIVKCYSKSLLLRIIIVIIITLLSYVFSTVVLIGDTVNK